MQSKDYSTQNTRFPASAGPYMYAPRMPNSSQSTVSAQVVYTQPPYYYTPHRQQISQPPNAVPPHQHGSLYRRYTSISPVQTQVRPEGYNYPPFQPPYVGTSSHGNVPYSLAMAPITPVLYSVGPVGIVPATNAPAYQPSHLMPHSQSQALPMQTSQPQASQASKGCKVVIRDPSSNKDITQEILGQRTGTGKETKQEFTSISEEERRKEAQREKVRSDFALQVAATLESDDDSPSADISEGKGEVEKEQSRSGGKSKTLPIHKSVPFSKSSSEFAPRILTKHSEPAEEKKEPEVTQADDNEIVVASDYVAQKTEDKAPVEKQDEMAAPMEHHGIGDVEKSDVVAPKAIENTEECKEDQVFIAENPIGQGEGKLDAFVGVSERKQTGGTELTAHDPVALHSTDSVSTETKAKICETYDQGLPFPEAAVSSTDVTEDTEVQKQVSQVLDNTENCMPIASVKEEGQPDLLVEQVIPMVPLPVTEGEDAGMKLEDKEECIESETSPEDDEVAKSTEAISVASDLLTADVDVQNDQTESKMVNGHDHANQTGSAFREVPKKKKQKQRIRDISAKGEKSDQNLMSAYVDKPVKEELPESEELVVQEAENEDIEDEAQEAEEEATWEDKEHNLANESGVPMSPKKAATAIISNEDGTINENTKLQYDRDFLLKLQFASICTEKPKDLPDIEIVLNKAHEPTKPIVQGQTPGGQYNDFTPHFMRHAGGGRQPPGGRGGKVGRGPGPAPKKIITSSFDNKVELKKSENAWVRPTVKADSLPDEERKQDELYRAVRGILNKLTPQKFDKLVDRMVALEIDSPEKLEHVIDLIFQKAISEQNFSEAYAKMCKVLVDKQASSSEGTSWGNFRKILLNKCQKEFQKEKADERTLMADREKEFDKPEEKKAWLEELDLKAQKQRIKTLGNIRFIGELFKLEILRENIMHQCIFNLLNNGDEDSIECLCKLLRTIGKDLDHEQGKLRMDQYFGQMNKMATQKKVSSRVKFMLLDVIELRESKWVPRREGEGPKTIDQIHEEAKIQQQKVQQAIQEDARQKKMQGRESPYARPPAAATGEEAWSQVSSKGKPLALDPSKLRLTKRTDSDTISLGPGGKSMSSWAKGAGVGLSRTGGGESQKQEINRFSVLSDPNTRSVDTKSRAGLRTQFSARRVPDSRGGMPSTKGLGRDSPRDSPVDTRNEKEKAIAVARQFSNQGSRTPSPSVRLEEEKGSQPSSAPQTPVDSPAETPTPTPPPNVEAIKERVRKETSPTIDEYIYNGDESEAAQCVLDLKANQYLAVFVSEGINHVLESKSDNRVKLGQLIHCFVRREILSVEQIIEGLNEVLEFAEDLATDIPYIWKYLGEIIGNFVHDGTVPLHRVKQSLEPLIECRKAGKLMAEILSSAVKASSEEQVAEQWQNSGLKWDSILHESEDEAQFIEDKKMGFLANRSLPHASQIQRELKQLQETKGVEDSDAAFSSWIQTNFPVSERTSEDHIQRLTREVCRHCLKKDNSNYTLNRDKFSIYVKELAKYVADRPDRELQVLFAAQKLYFDLEQPREFLSPVFEILYDEEIVSDQTIYTWEASDKEPHGKCAALSAVKGFLLWLRAPDSEKQQES